MSQLFRTAKFFRPQWVPTKDGMFKMEGYSYEQLLNFVTDSRLEKKMPELIKSRHYIDSLPDNCTVYFAKGLRFPRAKFKDWATSRNINVTIKPEKADVIIFNPDAINEEIKTASNECYYNKLHVFQYQGVNYSEPVNSMYYSYEEFKDLTPSLIYLADYIPETRKKILQNAWTLLNDHWNKDWIHFKDVFSTINSDLIELTESDFDEIISELENKHTRDYAVEKLANLNVENGIFWVLMIYFMKSSYIYESNMCSTVNFKSLMNYLETLKGFSEAKHRNSAPIDALNRVLTIVITNNLDVSRQHSYIRRIMSEAMAEKLEYLMGDYLKISEIDFIVKYPEDVQEK